MAIIPVTRKQFNSNPRSKEIRDISLGIIKNVDALLHKPDVDQLQASASIEALSGQLIGLGITPNMQCGKPEDAYHDPVVMAEYVAGQILESMGRAIPSESSVVPIIEELSVAQYGNIHVLETPAEKPKPLVDFMVMRSVVNVVYRFLDAD